MTRGRKNRHRRARLRASRRESIIAALLRCHLAATTRLEERCRELLADVKWLADARLLNAVWMGDGEVN